MEKLNTSQGQNSSNSYQQKEKVRADIGIYPKTNIGENISDTKSIIIDVTTCCPISQKVLKNFKPWSPPESAVTEKLSTQYEKNWNIHDTSKANLIIFAIDSTTGTVGKEGKEFLRFLSQLSDKESSIELSRIYGRLSTAVQANRAYWI